MNYVKMLVKPLQDRMLSKKLCPACTKKLDFSKNRKFLSGSIELVECTCGRLYIHNILDRSYRRATKNDLIKIPQIV